MRKKLFSWISICCVSFCFAQSDSAVIRSLFDLHLTESTAYSNLKTLTEGIGGRLSGSHEAQKAVEWAKKAMKEAGADTVFLVPCMVPHWLRGIPEKCTAKNTKTSKLEVFSVCALGGSVGTGNKGITAPVIEVTSFDDLESKKDLIKGKIVFYNVFFNAKHIHTGAAYGETVKYRYNGASKAAKYGAVAVLVRSMTLAKNDSPHTGVMGYDTLIKERIPAAAISTLGADKLSALLKSKLITQLTLKMTCETLPDVLSYSVVGEIKGSSLPDEYIVVGGHLDSWDNGDGAHDDGSGVVQSISVLQILKKSGLKPKRSIRAIAFMNEENGTRGGKAYAEYIQINKQKHIAALESDAGGFTPRAITIEAGNDTVSYYQKWQKIFDPYDVKIRSGWGGADIDFMKKQGTLMFGFEPDSQRYFDYHHTKDDTFDKVNKRELELGAATIHAFIYLLDKYGLQWN